jgi:hypothetical protein
MRHRSTTHCSGLLALLLTLACGGATKGRSTAPELGEDPAPDPTTPAGSSGHVAAEGGASGDAAQGGRGVCGTGVGTAALGGGGASSAGASAEPGFLPPGCVVRNSMSTEQHCSLGAFCGDRSYVTECSRLNSSRWQCGCAPGPTDRTLEVSGALGTDACAVAVGLCRAPEAAFGPEVCEALADSSGTNSSDACAVSLVCDRRLEVEKPGVDAWLTRHGQAACTPSEPGSFDCGCRYLPTTASGFDVSTDSSSLICESLGQLCMRESGPERSADVSCLVTREVASDEGCRRHAVCSRSPASSDLEAALSARYAECVPKPAGGSSCYCSTHDATFAFDTAESPSPATCDATFDACEESAVIAASGAASCEPESAGAWENVACDADLSCSQAARVNGRAIVARGRLLVRCAREATGVAWACSCASDQQTASFMLGRPDADSAEACRLAPAACIEHISVHLGPYGPFVAAPDP